MAGAKEKGIDIPKAFTDDSFWKINDLLYSIFEDTET